MRNVFIRVFAERIKSRDDGRAVKRYLDDCGNFLIISWFKWQKDSIEKQTFILSEKLIHVVENKGLLRAFANKVTNFRISVQEKQFVNS
jgi:hypothetical protein